MYRIKPNGNLNLVIADINVSVNATSEDGVLVDKKLFDSSAQAKGLVNSKLLLVEDADVAVKQSVQPKTDKETKEKAFVVQGNVSMTSEGMFIREASEEKEETVVEVEQVQSQTKEAEKEELSEVIVAETKVEAPIEEVTVETEPKVELKEVQEAPKAEASNENKKAPVTKKPAPKKDTNKK